MPEGSSLADVFDELSTRDADTTEQDASNNSSEATPVVGFLELHQPSHRHTPAPLPLIQGARASRPASLVPIVRSSPSIFGSPATHPFQKPTSSVFYLGPVQQFNTPDSSPAPMSPLLRFAPPTVFPSMPTGRTRQPKLKPAGYSSMAGSISQSGMLNAMAGPSRVTRCLSSSPALIRPAPIAESTPTPAERPIITSIQRLTPTARLFANSINLDPQSFVFAKDDWFVMMRLRKLKQWDSRGMSPQHWADATDAFNLKRATKDPLAPPIQVHVLQKELLKAEDEVAQRLRTGDFVGECYISESPTGKMLISLTHIGS